MSLGLIVVICDSIFCRLVSSGIPRPALSPDPGPEIELFGNDGRKNTNDWLKHFFKETRLLPSFWFIRIRRTEIDTQAKADPLGKGGQAPACDQSGS